LSPSLFPHIANTGIGEEQSKPAIAAPTKSPKNNIFSMFL